ncbi:(deoxy)nucleoside triphosphate pyrophosphohydrolase [Sphingobium algorifonticola]|uniref:8-oxo-dGTP diphosphatase n=1 Tax=Sphingobium algorifonticola TaxID=2008318 RepID=A0A437J5H9_9SPHN|nr:(deoxy)nucleoside triphosphate pyrophosphohydrolase [Sphingobium algorifonticola]RVT40166.1 (deoxy)nucleoside triphosphate pyrophosphohydrolase [Sphingobium algorifonticola]
MSLRKETVDPDLGPDISPAPTPGPPVPLLHVVAVALVDGDGRVLLQQRPPGKSLAGLWEFPGGKIDAGETPEAALVRELEEELGIATHASCLAPAAFASEPLDGKHLVMLLYVCRKWTGVPQARHATALQWLRPAQMYGVAMPKADLPLIGLLDALL